MTAPATPPDATPRPRTYAVRLHLEAFDATTGAGLLAIQLEVLALQERLIALGVHKEAAEACRPEHRALLRDLAAALPLPAVLDAVAAVRPLPIPTGEDLGRGVTTDAGINGG